MLWDVDGTLISTSGLGRDVFGLAVEHVLGRHPGDPDQVQMSGKTDPLIALEILAFAGLADDEAEHHLPDVIARLEAELAALADTLREQGEVLPGVAEVLARLDADPSVMQSVLTGNTTANAAVKLSALGLERWLDLETGAYGSDNVDRDQLVPVALERARRLRGRDFGPEQVWLVGDTPRDLACARAGGVRCLLVATGRVSHEELRGLPADMVLPDLAAVDDVCAILIS